METCLQNLWELIRNDISEIIEKNSDDSEKKEVLAKNVKLQKKAIK